LCVAAFAETLARFGPDLELVAELALIESDEDDAASLTPGVVAREWLDARRSAARGTMARSSISVTRTRSLIGAVLAERVLHYGFDDLDAGELRRRVPRAFTQEISR
jgi:hypothetical protein